MGELAIMTRYLALFAFLFAAVGAVSYAIVELLDLGSGSIF